MFYDKPGLLERRGSVNVNKNSFMSNQGRKKRRRKEKEKCHRLPMIVTFPANHDLRFDVPKVTVTNRLLGSLFFKFQLFFTKGIYVSRLLYENGIFSCSNFDWLRNIIHHVGRIFDNNRITLYILVH